MASNKLNDLDPKRWLKFQKSWFIHNPPPRKKGVLVHPAKFPETLAQEFIEFFTKQGEIVLDPMAGTGSTLVAALRAGRHSYGIELNAKYAGIASQVIEEERRILGEQVATLKAEIIHGDATKATTYSLPSANYMLTCYDDQTEILTENGWTLFSQLRQGDKVATLEEGRYLRFRQPLRIIQAPYDGSLYSIRTSTVDLRVTLDHNMYVRDRYPESDFRLIPARQIIGKDVEYKLNAEWEGAEQASFCISAIDQRADRARSHGSLAREVPMDSWLEFFGYWISTGDVNTRDDSVDLRTCDAGLAQRFMQVIQELGEIPRSYPSEQDIHVQFRSPLISRYLAPLGCAHERHIPRPFFQLSKRQLKILCRALLAGAGDEGQEQRFWTSSARLKDDFQELLLRVGYVGICREQQPVGHLPSGTGDPSWMVEVWKVPFTSSIPVDQNNQPSKRTEVCEEIIPYQGMVFCVQVPEGIVYVRRNGKAVWCGNSPPYWDMLHARGAQTQKKRRASEDLDVHYSDDPNDLGNIHDYEEFLDRLVNIYKGLKPLLCEKAYLTIIVKNVKKGGKVYPLAWDIARELAKTYTLKDEKLWLQDNQRLAPFGLGSAWVSNTFHHYCLQFRNE